MVYFTNNKLNVTINLKIKETIKYDKKIIVEGEILL